MCCKGLTRRGNYFLYSLSLFFQCSTKPDVFSDYSKLNESDTIELDYEDTRQASDTTVTETDEFRDASKLDAADTLEMETVVDQ